MKKHKVEIIIKGLCLRCWHNSKKKLCSRGFVQDDNKTECRYASGVKNG